MHPLDQLITTTTAFRDWAAMLECLRNGYVPTIRMHTRRSRLLARVVKAHGFNVFLRS